MRILLSLLFVLVLTRPVLAELPWENGALKVSDNGRYLQHANGKPFFWLADTAWLLFQKMDREEVKRYFRNRKSKGYNVVQCILFQGWSDLNAFGDTAFVEKNLTRFNTTPGSDPKKPEEYDYWDHVEYAADVAAENGIYLAALPLWGPFVNKTPPSMQVAQELAANLAERFKNRLNIVWVNGGSARAKVKLEIWEAIGATLKKHDPHHLITFHTFGRTQSSAHFNSSAWLDFNMFTSGHRRYDQDDTVRKFGEDNWRYVLDDLAKTPRKPTLDGEPSYEATPHGLHDLTQPYWTADDVRRYAYWSVFAGAAGHTYGHNSVRQVYKKSDPSPAGGAKETFLFAMDAPGAGQMQHLKKLLLSRPYFDRINDQALVTGDEGEKYDRVLVTKGKDFLMAYSYTGRSFTLQLGGISGEKVRAWWFNPRTGKAMRLGTYQNTGSKAFDPPGVKANGRDWVLVLDDASKNLKAPGGAIERAPRNQR